MNTLPKTPKPTVSATEAARVVEHLLHSIYPDRDRLSLMASAMIARAETLVKELRGE